jgi:hypothetical protein
MCIYVFFYQDEKIRHFLSEHRVERMEQCLSDHNLTERHATAIALTSSSVGGRSAQRENEATRRAWTNP